MSLSEFLKVTKDFLNDLLSTYPELETGLDPNLRTIVAGSEPDSPATKEVFEYVSAKWPPHFFDILGEKATMFETECHLLPGIDFHVLWNENITDKTKLVIWKYLKLIVLTVVGSMPGGENASKVFQDMNDEELKEKLEEATKDINDFFKDMPIPNPETLKDHIQGLMTGKLGQLAKEIADETVGAATPETMQDMLKDPSKMFGLVNSVGSKIDSKIKSGELKESELMEEASEMLKKMKDFPGLDQLFKKFAGGGKVDLSGMASKLNQNVKMAKTKERLSQKLKERQQQGQAAAAAPAAPAEEAVPAKPKNSDNNKKKKKKKKKVPAPLPDQAGTE